MKFINWVLVGSFLFISCGAAGPDIELEPYLVEYQQFTGVSPYRIPFSFVNKFKDPKVAAYCIYSNINSIQINKPYWDQISVVVRRNLIYHELGHCLFHLRHFPEVHPGDGCAKSLLHPEVVGTVCYEIHKEELLKDYLKLIKGS